MTQKYARCKYPECMGNAAEERDSGLCRRHAEMLRFFMWMMENVKFKDVKEPDIEVVVP